MFGLVLIFFALVTGILIGTGHINLDTISPMKEISSDNFDGITDAITNTHVNFKSVEQIFGE